MDSAQLIASLLGAGGGGAVLLALTNGLVKWLSGASGRERIRNTDLETQRAAAVEERDAAVARADTADLRRRLTAEYASRLRRQLIENGVTPEDWPDTDSTIPTSQLRRLRKQSKE